MTTAGLGLVDLAAAVGSVALASEDDPGVAFAAACAAVADVAAPRSATASASITACSGGRLIG